MLLFFFIFVVVVILFLTFFFFMFNISSVRPDQMGIIKGTGKSMLSLYIRIFTDTMAFDLSEILKQFIFSFRINTAV